MANEIIRKKLMESMNRTDELQLTIEQGLKDSEPVPFLFSFPLFDALPHWVRCKACMCFLLLSGWCGGVQCMHACCVRVSSSPLFFSAWGRETAAARRKAGQE